MTRPKTLIFGGIAAGVGIAFFGSQEAEQDEPTVQSQDLDAVCNDIRQLVENLAAMPSSRNGS